VLKALGHDIKELFNYRELLLSITIREIKVRYKQSILGILWSILQPLSMMAIFTVVFSYFIKIPSDGIPYPIFSLTGLLPWTFFSSALSFAIPSVVSNISLVTKIYFPREIFPLASVLAALVDFCIAVGIYICMLLYYRIGLTVNAFYVVPLLTMQIVLTLGISFFAAAINVYYRDVKYVLPFALQFWMYACPIIYPLSVVPKWLIPFYMLNPMAPIIDGYRRALLLGMAPDLSATLIASAVTVFVFFLSYRFFKQVEMSFADVI